MRHLRIVDAKIYRPDYKAMQKCFKVLCRLWLCSAPSFLAQSFRLWVLFAPSLVLQNHGWMNGRGFWVILSISFVVNTPRCTVVPCVVVNVLETRVTYNCRSPEHLIAFMNTIQPNNVTFSTVNVRTCPSLCEWFVVLIVWSLSVVTVSEVGCSCVFDTRCSSVHRLHVCCGRLHGGRLYEQLKYFHYNTTA